MATLSPVTVEVVKEEEVKSQPASAPWVCYVAAWMHDVTTYDTCSDTVADTHKKKVRFVERQSVSNKSDSSLKTISSANLQ